MTPPNEVHLFPPFRGDHVGSLLRPAKLLEARGRVAAGNLSEADLRQIENECIRAAVRNQEEIGLGAVTDGEFRRAYFHFDFLAQLGGVVQKSQADRDPKFQFKGTEFHPPSLRVEGRVRHEQPILGDDFDYLRSVTDAVPKITLPSPSTAHFRGGRASISKSAYPDLDAFFSDLAAAYRAEIADLAQRGCRYIQIDEVDFAYLCDQKMRREIAERGDDPDGLCRIYADLINESIRDRPTNMVVGLHVCRGNFRGNWTSEGGYETVAKTLFGDIDVDAFFLEFDDARSGGFEPLQYVRPSAVVILGLITSKRPELEPKDMIKRRIEEASRIVPLERLGLSPQCGFASTFHGNPLTEDEQTRKLELVVEIAQEVWGRA